MSKKFKRYEISELMQESGVNFGTSGARGLVVAMNDRICFAYTMGFLEYLKDKKEFFPGQKVALSGDLRPSTKRIKQACKAAIEYCGGEVIDCGEVPTPTLCYFAYEEGYPSLMVTGSHIPDDRNGIKFNRAHGEFLKNDELAMRECIVELPEYLFDQNGMLITSQENNNVLDISNEYIERYVDFFGSNALVGMKLGVYEHSAVGRDILTDILSSLGAEVIRLGRSETFIPVDTEAVRNEDMVLARQWSKEYALDAILTTDGDSDRPLLSDENGVWIRGDVLGIIASNYVNASGVATPISCNTALEMLNQFDNIKRTKIGSPYVVDAMNSLINNGVLPVVGYEANGGFLVASKIVKNNHSLTALPTRDAVLPMLCALMSVKEDISFMSLSEVVNNLPQRYTISDRIQNLERDKSLQVLKPFSGEDGKLIAEEIFGNIAFKVDKINLLDGVRIFFSSGDIIHLRPSGNAPELRIYVESDTYSRAQELLSQAFDIAATWR